MIAAVIAGAGQFVFGRLRSAGFAAVDGEGAALANARPPVRELEYENLITQQPYMRANRTQGSRLVLTDAGQTRVALGSGAPPTWAQREDDNE